MEDDNQPGEPKQKTPKGHEIPVPEREDFLRDLKKAAQAKPSTPHSHTVNA